MSPRYRVLYLDYDGLENTVFESQVLALCQGLLARGVDLRYLGYNLPRRKERPASRAKRERCAAALGDRAKWAVKLPYLGSYNLVVHALLLLPALLRPGGGTLILHCRGNLSGGIALYAKRLAFWKRIKVVTDFRGVHAEHLETYPEVQTPRWSPLLQRIKLASFHAQEKRCIRGSDYALAVTRALQAHFRLSPCSVIPCNYDDKAFHLGADAPPFALDRARHPRVFIYSGGLQEYQCIRETLAIFKFFAAAYDAFMIFLTPQSAKAEALFAEAGIPESHYRTGSGKPDELRAYFLMADFAFILRHDNIVNRVASPVKVGEYLGCGLPLLYTACTGDLASMAAADPLGVEVELGSLGDEAYLRDLYARIDAFAKARAKAEINATARKRFSLADGIEELLRVYASLA